LESVLLEKGPLFRPQLVRTDVALDDHLADDGVEIGFVTHHMPPRWSSRFHPGPPPKTRLVPARGTPVIIDASRVRARRSSGSRSWTSFFPQALASIWISDVTARNQCATRSAPASMSSRLTSSGSCVVIPTGQRPV